MAQAQPVVGGIRRGGVGQLGLRAVADVEEIAQHVHGLALLPFAEQGRDRHAEKLAEQVEQRGFDGGDGVNGGAQIEGLQAAAAGVAIGKAPADAVQNIVVGGDRLADHQRPRVFQRLADALAAGHFADAGAARAVLEDHDVAGEEGARARRSG